MNYSILETLLGQIVSYFTRPGCKLTWSVSSILSINEPPVEALAAILLNNAVLRDPRCIYPVGDGAKRARIGNCELWPRITRCLPSPAVSFASLFPRFFKLLNALSPLVGLENSVVWFKWDAASLLVDELAAISCFEAAVVVVPVCRRRAPMARLGTVWCPFRRIINCLRVPYRHLIIAILNTMWFSSPIVGDVAR